MFFQTVNIHFIDLLVIGFLAFGAYKGYKLGWIVQGLELLIVFIGFYVVAYISHQLFLSLLFQGLRNAELFASLVLAGAFIIVLWVTKFIQLTVTKKINQTDMNIKDRIWGIVFGMLKYMIIIGVFLVAIRQVDIYTNFLPKTEKIAPVKGHFKSILGTGTYYMITLMSPSLKYEHNRPVKKIRKPIKYVEPKSADFYDDEF